MSLNLRALIVILALSGLAFHFARPLLLKYCEPQEFARRRNLWFGLTIAAFILPSFWLFVLVAAPLLIWAGKKDSNPIALYLLLMHVIPPLVVQIPTIAGIHEIFGLDMYRLLSIAILLPAALRLRRSQADSAVGQSKAMELLLVAYGILQVVLFVRPDGPDAYLYQNSPTTALRTAFLYLIDAYLLYYVASRSADRRRLNDALASFLMACMIMAPLAVFEGLKHWALYDGLPGTLGGYLMRQYAMRGGSLRAVASAGHSLALGYLLAVAIGFWLYLRQSEARSWIRFAVPAALGMGLVFAYSRGPWAGAVIIFLTYTLLSRSSGKSGFLKVVIVSAVVGAGIFASPLGNRIVSVLPYVGKPQSLANVDYRERLAQRSMQMIEDHPFFGDQNAYTELSDLRQGEGIIDFVNTYAYVAVFYGLIGLFCFAGFILIALARVYRVTKAVRDDPELADLGASLAATILGTMIMIADCSFIYGYAQLFYLLAGLGAAYVAVARTAAAPAKLPAAATPTAQA